jgi:undecaprenyl diphosphate synthase
MADSLCRLYFTDVLWPDFKEQNLYRVLVIKRERRFGKTSEQIK